MDSIDELAVDLEVGDGSDGTEPRSPSHWFREGAAMFRVPANKMDARNCRFELDS